MHDGRHSIQTGKREQFADHPKVQYKNNMTLDSLASPPPVYQKVLDTQ